MNNRSHHSQGRLISGLLLLAVGVLLIGDRLDLLMLPGWIFSWPMILIVVGLFVGIKEGFRGPSWLILLGIGTFFIIDDIVSGINLRPYILPAVIIIIGLALILRTGKRSSYRNQYNSDRAANIQNPQRNPIAEETVQTGTEGKSNSDDAWSYSQEDVVNSTSIFAGIHKKILSKNFKGGESTNFMGGSEYDLTQADIHGTVELDITAIFGGCKLTVPRNWEVKSENVAIFGGFDDKRAVNNLNADPNKILIIKGTTIFGGIEVRSF